MNTPTSEELGREALEVLRRSWDEEPSHARFQRMIELGWINSRGEVTRLLGGDADPEVDLPSAKPSDSAPWGNGHSDTSA